MCWVFLCDSVGSILGLGFLREFVGRICVLGLSPGISGYDFCARSHRENKGGAENKATECQRAGPKANPLNAKDRDDRNTAIERQRAGPKAKPVNVKMTGPKATPLNILNTIAHWHVDLLVGSADYCDVLFLTVVF